jgi:solute carrier family 8 (sodium/calcium exchanger)
MDNTLSDVDCPNSQSAHVQRKFLVFESSLDELFRHCPECGKPVIKPMTGNISTGNVLVSASVLFSGSTIHRFATMADILKLQSLSESEFYRIQDACLFPIIQEAYDRHIDTIIAWLGDAPLSLIGDGRCDSPGHSAKYGLAVHAD